MKHQAMLLLLLTALWGCSGGDEDSTTGDGDAGGGNASGGQSMTGGGSATGGINSTGGASGGAQSSGGVSGDGGNSSGGSASTGGSGGSDDCAEDCAGQGLTCCDGQCVNAFNDVNNCGACGKQCEGDYPYCNNGTCEAPPCNSTGCGPNCCNTECCGVGQLCCMVNVGPGVLGCFDKVNGTCPTGCPFCECTAPDTPVATAIGDVDISDLRIGDLVYSIEDDGIVLVPLIRVNRTAVVHHRVLAVRLQGGGQLRISPDHPLGDGRVLSDLQMGESMHGATIQELELVDYEGTETFDILPASKTGIYFAAGLPIGSTLFAPSREDLLPTSIEPSDFGGTSPGVAASSPGQTLP